MRIHRGIERALYLLGGALSAGAAGLYAWNRAAQKRDAENRNRSQLERDAGHHLCFSTIESLAYAIEAGDPYHIGHLDCVLRYATALARVMSLPETDLSAVRAAALLHNIGRLGVPEHILNKTDALTPEEQEKLRLHPVLGARILAPIPFPWPVVPLVRHHAEHWDGSGYPDGLRGEEIPLGARILSVANVYSAMMLPRPFRPAYSSAEAITEIETLAGSQFDPAVVAALRSVISQMNAEPIEDSLKAVPSGIGVSGKGGSTPDEARAALDDIAAAQRETLGLYTLAQAVSESLHLEAVSDTMLSCVREIVPCAACVLFLPEDDGEFLRAQSALGINARHLLGSLARIGTYLTGRAFSRGEIMRASFLSDDLILRDVSDPWTAFRSTVIVPLTANGQSVGTLNLYAEEPDAFGPDAMRVMRLVATQAGRALDNARKFDEVQETAYTDALTGLRNGRFLREFLEREINRASRENTPLAVLNIDLDNFKPINDRFGHARGDQTLREVAEILNAHVRSYDLAARYAGDEFVVVLSRAGRVPAEIVASKLKAAVEKHGQKLVAREPGFPQLGISIGVALYPEDGQDLAALLCRSDAAMYADKQERRAGRQAA